ncbi:tRNA (guanine(37)-N1)-methyltransferase [Sparassis crispa]|uniref:tRNA (guanine(37)-N1)-methyltransferase n=1 Tax=Sparassis crispa TaxID=139825 RepID=A0A401G5K5_9APHY|nr:tRNA (guanine(37)-N1)-methyltransferase [Sparassis crispa]GBE77437.1 tRNA (guanine(37)-N1)-methyltransferase [Sparassis crispa]
MSIHSLIDTSPPIHRGMVALDRDAFHKPVPVLAAKITPKITGVFIRAPTLKTLLMDLPRVLPVHKAPDNDRLVLFKFSDEADLTPEAAEFLQQHSAQLVKHTLHFHYDDWNADEILNAVLPEDLSEGAPPSSFAVSGHIAHMNLRPEYYPYKYLIGQVILDKNPGIKTVVNKIDNISNQFRIFNMELLAGEPDYKVVHHEANCRFTFDFTQVYWNSRLNHEHERIVQLFSPQDVIADVFAGVGPFSIPAAKKGCGVLANDLNPKSYKYLRQNIDDNKVTQLVRPSCEDGRGFIGDVFNNIYDLPLPPVLPSEPSRSQLRRLSKQQRGSPHANPAPVDAVPLVPPRRRITHFVMNLPDSAIEFLDAFRGVLRPVFGSRDLSGLYYSTSKLPMIHCYCFAREREPESAESDIRRRVEEKLGHALGQEMSLHFVRAVAPHKQMYCISFRLPYKVAYAA